DPHAQEAFAETHAFLHKDSIDEFIQTVARDRAIEQVLNGRCTRRGKRKDARFRDVAEPSLHIGNGGEFGFRFCGGGRRHTCAPCVDRTHCDAIYHSGEDQRAGFGGSCGGKFSSVKSVRRIPRHSWVSSGSAAFRNTSIRLRSSRDSSISFAVT